MFINAVKLAFLTVGCKGIGSLLKTASRPVASGTSVWVSFTESFSLSIWLWVWGQDKDPGRIVPGFYESRSTCDHTWTRESFLLYSVICLQWPSDTSVIWIYSEFAHLELTPVIYAETVPNTSDSTVSTLKFRLFKPNRTNDCRRVLSADGAANVKSNEIIVSRNGLGSG